MPNQLSKTIDNKELLESGLKWVRHFAGKALDGGPVKITLCRPTRSLDQNSKMWAMLTDISRQVEWYGQKPSPEDWKHILTAALKGQRTVPGIKGELVVLGLSTSKMSAGDMSELIELMYSFGVDNDVTWSDDKKADFEQSK